MAVYDESGHQADREVGRPSMPCMFNLQLVVALVRHRFHQCPALKAQFFVQQEQAMYAQLLLRERHKGVAKGIDIALQFRQTHRRLRVAKCLFGDKQPTTGVSLI